MDSIKYIVENVKAAILFVDGIDKQINNINDICKAMGAKNPIKTIVFSQLSDTQRKSLDVKGIKI